MAAMPQILKRLAASAASAAIAAAMTVALTPAGAQAAVVQQAITSVTNDNSPFSATFSVGWDFTVTAPITVTSLGKFQIGTPDDSDVGLYVEGGALLASTTVLTSDPSQTVSGFTVNYHDITPIVLAPGNYVIFGQTRASAFIETSLATTFASQITWNKGVASGSGSAFDPLPSSAPASWPIENSNPSRYFGPTFAFIVPEPASLGMIGVAGLALAGHRRRA
jgi:hypothetical protein